MFISNAMQILVNTAVFEKYTAFMMTSNLLKEY